MQSFCLNLTSTSVRASVSSVSKQKTNQMPKNKSSSSGAKKSTKTTKARKPRSAGITKKNKKKITMRIGGAAITLAPGSVVKVGGKKQKTASIKKRAKVVGQKKLEHVSFIASKKA